MADGGRCLARLSPTSTGQEACGGQARHGQMRRSDLPNADYPQDYAAIGHRVGAGGRETEAREDDHLTDSIIMHTKTALLSGWATAALAVSAVAAPQTFDFKDPKGVNNAVFKLDAPLESINGTANGVSGTITFDPANPAALTGRIVVGSDSLHVPNPMMKEHMQGKDWMDIATHKEITFEAVRVANVKTTGDDTTADVTGKFTLRGVTKEITVPVRFTYLKDKLGARSNGRQQGDLLVVRSTFSIQRGDYGINPKAPADKVAEEVQLTLSLAGAAPRN